MSRGQSRPEEHRPNGIAVETRVVSGQQALDIIKAENAFAKNIATQRPSEEPVFENPTNGWSFLTRQLQDPEYYRPARTVPEGANRKKYYDPSDGKWYERYVDPKKGESKPGATYTKKTAVSLLPADGRMEFFPQKHGIVMVFDVAKCFVKQYIFEHNAASVGRWWLDQPDPAKRKYQLMRSTTLDAIRQQHKNAKVRGEISKWNEVLPDLCADAVIAVAVPQLDFVRCLNAQYRRLILRRELNIDVPLLVMTTNKAVYEHTKAKQLQDLVNARTFPPASIYRDFYNAITSFEALPIDVPMPTVAVDIFQAIRERDFVLIEWALKQDSTCLKKMIDDKTPIQFAADLEYWDCVERIAKTIKTDAQDRDTAKYGYALLFAAWRNQKAVALTLLEAGAGLTWKCTSGEYTGYFAIHFAIHHHDSDLLKAILEKGGKKVANSKFESSIIPLQLALKRNQCDFVQLLLAHGAYDDDDVIEVAKAKSWDSVFVYCDAVILDAERCANIVSRLLPIAIKEKNTEAQRGLISIQSKMTCAMERSQLEENIISERDTYESDMIVEYKRLTDSITFLLKAFTEIDLTFSLAQTLYDMFRRKCLDGHEVLARRMLTMPSARLFDSAEKERDAIAAKNQCEQIESIFRKTLTDEADQSSRHCLEQQEVIARQVLMSGHRYRQTGFEIYQLCYQLKIQMTILRKESSGSVARFFGIDDKTAKINVLLAAHQLLETQLHAGGAASKEAVDAFKHQLTENAGWDKGSNSRTVLLIEQAEVLMKKPCAKLEGDVALKANKALAAAAAA